MLGEIKRNEGKETILLTNAPFRGYFYREGHYQTEVCGFDTSTKEKGYIEMHFVDTVENEVMKTNLRLRSRGNPEARVPLEKLLLLALEEEMEDNRNCYAVDLDVLLGLECQLLVRRQNGYYNICNVYPMDEELGAFVSEQENINQRFHRGIFDKD